MFIQQVIILEEVEEKLFLCENQTVKTEKEPARD